MANLFQTVAAGIGELKNVYQGPLVSQFNDDVPIWRGSEVGKHAWSGYQVIRPMKVQRNQGVGATSDGGNLPAIGRQTTIQAQIAAKYNYLRFGITGPMIQSSRTDAGSFVRGAAFELEEGYNDLRSDVNRQLSWDGTGDLALSNAAHVATTTFVIKGRESTEPALKFVDAGMVFDIYTSAGALVQAGITVNSISSGSASSATATLICDQNVTCSSGDVIVRAGSFGNEIQGLLTQLDGGTSTVFNIVRASYVQTQGNVIYVTNDGTSSGSSLPLSIDYLQRACDEAERRGGNDLDCLYSDYASRRFYQKILQADKRYVNTVKGDGGFAAKDKNYMEYNGIAWVADKDCPTRIFVLPKKYIEKYVLAEMDFADETGAMMIAQSDVDAFEVRVRLFANLFNAKASACSVLQSYVSP